MIRELIYIVEDDDGISELYESAFEGVYDIELFATAEAFFKRFAEKKPQLVILDIMLPDMDGYTILTKIRREDERLPVIIVSAKSDEMSFVKGLNKGADDYMAKPFSVLELMARVKAGLRRGKLNVTSTGGFTVDGNTYVAYYGDNRLPLTLKEFYLLRSLLSHCGATVTREELFKEVWSEDFMGETRTLDMHIASLREKIKAAGGYDCIITVRGVGYRLEVK